MNPPPKVDADRRFPNSLIRKRVSRACDECRSRKIRCDGADFCVTCSQTNRVCIYSSSLSDANDPKVKIRLLQQHLSNAQQVISDLEDQIPAQAIINHHDHRAQNLKIVSPDTMASSVCHFPHPDTSNKNTSDSTLIHFLLRSMSDDANVASLLTYATTHFVLPGSLVTEHYTAQIFQQLIPYAPMLDIVQTAFSNVFALCNVILEQDFRVRTQRLYDINSTAYQPEDITFMPLFHSVIALGMVYSSHIYSNLDYRQMLEKSESYSVAAMSKVPAKPEYESLLHLQIVLCRVLHLTNTSRLDLARSVLEDVSKSCIVRRLIRSVSTHEPARIDFSIAASRDIVWTVFFLDMHISALLNVPTFLPQPGPGMATVYAINTAAYNVANYRRSESDFLKSVSIAMAIELIKLIQLMTEDHKRFGKSDRQQRNKGKTVSQNSPTRNELRTQCETWEILLCAIFPDDDCNPTLLMIRRQLQTHLHLAQITLHHSSLAQKFIIPPRQHVPRNDRFEEKGACVQAALNTVNYTSSYLERDQTNTISWHSAYVIFISAVTLLTASNFMDLSDRESNRGAIDTAMLILSNTTYGSWHAKSCYTQFTQTLSGILTQPPPNKIPVTSSTTTRRPSYSSDTSTLVATNDASTSLTTHTTPTPSFPATNRGSGSAFRQPKTENDGRLNTTIDWGFD